MLSTRTGSTLPPLAARNQSLAVKLKIGTFTIKYGYKLNSSDLSI